MTDNLKKKTASALMWSLIDRGGQQIIQLIFMLVLARLLSTSDFGLVAILTIFTAVASLLQESGFSSALIRKKEVSDREYMSVFSFNLLVSVIAYITLFFVAPFIADFYDKPILTNLARFIFLGFVFNAFGIVQNVNLVRKMDFKTNTRITFIAGISSGMVAIAMAYMGYGVWALAVQLVLQLLVRNVLLWVYVRWLPTRNISMQPIREMFPFSSKLLMTAVMNHICSNLYSNVIAKCFSIGQAGVYSQANKLNMIPQSIISDGIKNVAYPLLTKMDDEERRVSAFRKIIRVTSFISFPVSLFLIIAAHPIVMVLLTEKWIGVVPLLQILAVGGAIYPLFNLVSTVMQYKGKPGVFLAVEFVRNVLLLLGIVLALQYGVIGLVASISIVNIFAFFVGYLTLGKVIAYRFTDVLRDMVPYMAIAMLVFAPLYYLSEWIVNQYVLVLAQGVIGGLLYLAIVKLMGSKVLDDLWSMLKNKGKL